MRVENSRTGQSADHTFLVIAGIGMDAEVVGDTNDGLKKAVGWLAYTEAGRPAPPGTPQAGGHLAGRPAGAVPGRSAASCSPTAA